MVKEYQYFSGKLLLMKERQIIYSFKKNVLYEFSHFTFTLQAIFWRPYSQMLPTNAVEFPKNNAKCVNNM